MIDWGINYLKWWTVLAFPMVMTTVLYWVVIAINEYKKDKRRKRHGKQRKSSYPL